MGRKGMKGFLKGVHKKNDSDDEDKPQPMPAYVPKPEEPKHAPANVPAKPAAAEAGSGSDSDSSDDGEKGPETRGKVLQRHKREMLAHKKTVQKLGAKKKDEAAKLTAEIEARHARELQEVDEREKQQAAGAAAGAAGGAAGGEGSAAAAAEQLAGVALGAGDDHKKPSKAQKRREKLAAQEAEREQRIAEEQANLGPSEKAVEEERLKQLLAPLELGVHEIRADGHCMYRALEDQLGRARSSAGAGTSGGGGGGGGAVPDYQALRRMAAAHIRGHADEFIPFIYDEDQEGSPAEQLEAYCVEMESTSVWGGQLELGALAQVLKRQIKVHALGMPTVTLGDEHAGAGVLQLCYLRHAFGLGEHYNSVVPLGSEGPAEAEAAPAAAAAGTEA